MVSSLFAVTKAARRVLRTNLDHFLGDILAMALSGDKSVSCTCCCFFVAMVVLGQLFTPRT